MNILIAITLLIIDLVVIDIDRKITLFVDLLTEIHIILGEEHENQGCKDNQE